jgi:PAS domain S-box-containing protein
MPASISEAFRSLVAHTSDGVICIRNNAIRLANPVTEKLSGYASAELVGRSPDDLFQPPLEVPRDRSASSPAVPSDCRLCHRDGSTVVVSAMCVPIDDDNGHLIVFKDRSAEKRLQNELQKAKQLESIAALSGGIAHDYNNLLTAIMGNISLAQSYISDDHPIFRLLRESLSASLLAKELTQKLITFSRGGSPVKRPTLIAPLLRGATEFSLSGSNVVAEFDFAPDLWPVEVDRSQLAQALHNLIINAREAMPEGGRLLVSAGNARRVLPDGDGQECDCIEIALADEGMGIDAADIGKIFDPYFSTKDKGPEKGMGLGLSICHSIIRKHKGTVQVTSEPGSGAVFTITIPATPEAEIQPSRERRPETPAPLPERARVLVMDDEERIRDIAGEMLARLGYEVALASTGEQAVALYTQAAESGHPFDAVILDLTVRGGMGGQAAIQQLSAVDPDVVAIVSSGYSNDPVMADFRRYGFSGVVAKPYRFEEMNATLQQVLCRKSGPDSPHCSPQST